MKEEGFTVCCMHSNMSKNDRKHTLNEFRNGKFRLLLSSDLTARGIDIQQVSLVINYDLPRDKENYIHRIGRAGSFGRKGVCINLITRDDVTFVRDLEKFYGINIEELPANIEELI